MHQLIRYWKHVRIFMKTSPLNDHENQKEFIFNCRIKITKKNNHFVFRNIITRIILSWKTNSNINCLINCIFPFLYRYLSARNVVGTCLWMYDVHLKLIGNSRERGLRVQRKGISGRLKTNHYRIFFSQLDPQSTVSIITITRMVEICTGLVSSLSLCRRVKWRGHSSC